MFPERKRINLVLRNGDFDHKTRLDEACWKPICGPMSESRENCTVRW